MSGWYRRRRYAVVNPMKAKRIMGQYATNRLHLVEVAAVKPPIVLALLNTDIHGRNPSEVRPTLTPLSPMMRFAFMGFTTAYRLRRKPSPPLGKHGMPPHITLLSLHGPMEGIRVLARIGFTYSGRGLFSPWVVFKDFPRFFIWGDSPDNNIFLYICRRIPSALWR